jgi:hypothetical protein
MGQLESEIGDVAFGRVLEAEAPAPRSLIRRIEDFAIDNIKAISIGASAAIVLVAAGIVLQDSPARQSTAPAPDPIISGSIGGLGRVPSLPEWQAIRKPVEIMTLNAPQFERTPMIFGARRSNRNDREDFLSWTSNAPAGPEARIALLRSAAPAAAPSLFIDMTRQQAERGVAVTRAGRTGLLQTKFGPLEVADMTFSDAGGGAQACLGFRTAPDGDAPILSGWYCAAQGAAVERPELACFIDRLTLLRSGDDQALRSFFTEAEKRRRPCSTTRSTAGRKPTWLDHDGRAPAMRGSDDVTGSIGVRRR